jgi:hypothetical protein
MSNEKFQHDYKRPFAVVSSPSEQLIIVNLYDICSIESVGSIGKTKLRISLKNGHTIELNDAEYSEEISDFVNFVANELTSYKGEVYKF